MTKDAARVTDAGTGLDEPNIFTTVAALDWQRQCDVKIDSYNFQLAREE